MKTLSLIAAIALSFCLQLSAVAQQCPQPFTIRQSTCPSGVSSCTVGGSGLSSSLTWLELDRDLLNIIGLCNNVGRYTFPTPAIGYMKSDASGNVNIINSLGSGTPNSSTFLRGDLIWAVPAGGNNTFSTIATTSGTSPVASTTTDTLNVAAGSGITVTGNSGTKTVTIAVVNPLNQSTTGNAGTASVLASNGSNCSSGLAASGVDAAGNAEGCTTYLQSVSTPTSSTLGGVKSLSLGSNQFFTALDTSGNFSSARPSCATLSDAASSCSSVPTTITGNAGTATALAADPGDCASGQAPTGINASGTATGCAAYLLASGNAASATTATSADNLTKDTEAWKLTDSQTVTLSTAQIADDQLILSSVPVGHWKVEIYLHVHCSALGGFSSNLSGSAVVSLIDTIDESFDSGGDTVPGTATGGGGVVVSGDTEYHVRSVGSVVITTAGSLAVNWAQLVVNASPTRINSGSYLRLHKMP